MATLTDVKTNITNQIISGFGSEDEADNIQFKTGINQALNDHLDGFVAILQAKANNAQPAMAPAPMMAVAPAKKGGRNGYNEFAAELKANLIKELGSEEAAKVEFKKRGGVTGTWVRDAWHALSNEQKKVYNERAKAGRAAALPQAPQVPQMVMTPHGAVPIQVAAPKRAKTKWQLFQGAWSTELKAKKDAGEEVPSFCSIGERTKACSAAYKDFKAKPEVEQNAYLQMHV